jgi:hypothetical protein
LIDLSEVDEEAAHTLIHYLYTGRFEIIHQREESAFIQYKRSLVAFCAACICGIDGLREIAKDKMTSLLNEISLIELQSLTEEFSANIPHMDSWLLKHIEDKIITEVTNNESYYGRESLLPNCIGRCAVFDKAVVHTLAALCRQYRCESAEVFENDSKTETTEDDVNANRDGGDEEDNVSDDYILG